MIDLSTEPEESYTHDRTPSKSAATCLAGLVSIRARLVSAISSIDAYSPEEVVELELSHRIAR